MKIHHRWILLALVLPGSLLLEPPACAQTEDLARGVVIEKVVSATDPAMSYALYLPSTYVPTRKYPVLYCFDPAARGAVPVTRFRDAAEKYNYILVGSNNSRNGPSQPLNEIVVTMWDDTHTWFSIDDRRAYVAGFSGGARVALSVGFWLSGKVVGAIATGGGFPPSIPLTRPRQFVLFASAGTEDFNNPEIQALARALEGSSPPCHLMLFEGGHAWLPPELAQEAIEWLEIQAIRTGLKEKDQSLIDHLYEQLVVQSKNAEEARDFYRAYHRYSAAARDFAGLRDTAFVQKRADELRVTKEVREAVKREKEMGDEQTYRVQKIRTLIGALSQSPDNFESMAAFKDAISTQRKAAKALQPSDNRTVARRVTESLFVEFFERGNTAIFQKDPGSAVWHFFICTEIQPENPRVFYHLARAHALAGNKQKAISALQSAADKGFTGTQELTSQDFALIHTDKRFQQISELVKKNQIEKRD